MPHITLNEEQFRLVMEAQEPIEVRDPQGFILARFKPCYNQATIDEAKRRLTDPNTRWFTSAQVKAHMQALAEAAERGLNREELLLFFKKLQDETPSR